MLTGIGLRNFKAFGDEMQEASLSKITLIYGPNSGGKSSIIQALLLLKQSLRNNYPEEGRTLVPRGEFVDLGSVQSLLHRHDIARELGFNVSFIDRDNIEAPSHNLGLLKEYEIYDPYQPNASEEHVHLTLSGSESDKSDTTEAYALSGVRYKLLYRNEVLLDSRLKLSHTRRVSVGNIRWESDGTSWDGLLSLTSSYTDYHIGWLHILEPDVSRGFLPRLVLPELKERRKGALSERLDRRRFLSGLLGRQRGHSRLTNALAWADRIDEVIRAELIPYLESLDLEELINEAGIEDVAKEYALESNWWDGESTLDLRDIDLSDYELDLRSVAEDIMEQLTLPEQLSLSEMNEGKLMALTPENIPDDYERQLKLVSYIGPLRSAPERLYRLSSSESDAIRIQGEFSANVLYRNLGIRRRVNYWFDARRLDIPYHLDVIRLGEASLAGEFITIALTDKAGTQVTLADVGYGINQLLPIIIEGIASEEGSIICVEQPEIHLHPRLQANIADLMIDTIADERGKRKQWIVETHSELLILRLQRRIREGKIKPEDISVLYVDPNDESTEGSAIKVLRLGEDSYFKDPWPDGFFDDGLKERLPDDNEFESSDDDTNILDKLFSE